MSLLTEKALAASLKKMLSKKTLNKITVRDITDDCGVNRQTFYYHFHDVYDLVEWIFLQESKRFIAEGIADKSWTEMISVLMDGLLDEKEFIMNAYYSLNRRQLEEFLQELARPAIGEMIQRVIEEESVEEDDVTFVVDMTTYSLIGIITEWIASGMSLEYKGKFEKLLQKLDDTLDITVEKMIR